jgi:hypothetical protein
MSDILGVDLLTNPQITNMPEISMAKLDTVDLPSVSFEESAPPPRLVTPLSDVGQIRTNDGLENLNASSYLDSMPAPSRRMNDENLLKEKYEMLRKFERLQKSGVPVRKRFTLDSPLEEMRIELDHMRREKAADQTIKQFCDWYITGMSAVEWGSKNVAMMKAFGLNLEGLSESAQMNVGDLEEDFEELYDLYGDKLKMHPLVRIPIRTCMMVYMVHFTNQMMRKAPIPNIDEVLRTNPDIARQLASAAMQHQTQNMKSSNNVQPPPVPQSNPLAGLANFMSGMVPPPPQETNVRKVPTSIKSPVRMPKPPQSVQYNPAPPPPPPPAREMNQPTNIDDLLKSVNIGSDRKPKKGGSTGKNSVTIKL